MLQHHDPVTQRDTARCDCGRLANIRPVESSDYEFVSVCGCGRTLLISWNHQAPAPLYVAPVAQLELF